MGLRALQISESLRTALLALLAECGCEVEIFPMSADPEEARHASAVTLDRGPGQVPHLRRPDKLLEDPHIPPTQCRFSGRQHSVVWLTTAAEAVGYADWTPGVYIA